MSSQILALIPARAGSIRLKNKNLLPLGGRPLIAYTIQCAKKSRRVNRIIVSTDSEEIAVVAREFGAEVPFLRPKKISGPHSTEREFHDHCLLELKSREGYVPDLIVNLYPTCPFRNFTSIDSAVDLILRHPDADSLRSVKICSEHPFKMWTESTDKKWIKPFVKAKSRESHTLSYQLLPTVYVQNANIYITKPATLKKFKSTIGAKCLKFEMQEDESVDINTQTDFEFAEYLLRQNAKKSSHA